MLSSPTLLQNKLIKIYLLNICIINKKKNATQSAALLKLRRGNGNVSDMHASVRDIVAYDNSDICALRK